ncbi:hypothetical protein CKM354_000784200 [Cercospora kikuchii]|uniref:Cytochrome P450 n=1 Tax=Cercospora kikuchii TaxID=84275 RepID=A0A9P3CL01_9PEZI|nr:uncharacterized protein CKM354_000784200 [Cercospora kikuchii]GIZ44651.1 hypothetical protein CKM354_000784200 [Cercospora kikuchii]
MISAITLAVSITIIGFGFKAATCVARSLETDDFQTVHGCHGPKNVSGTGLASIWDGIRRIIRIISIDRSGEDILDDFFAPSFQGAHTIQETSFDGSIVLSTSEPENMQTILATRFQDFEIGRTRINQFYPLLGTSIFSSDGSAWKEARKMFRPHFTRSNLNDLESTARATT